MIFYLNFKYNSLDFLNMKNIIPEAIKKLITRPTIADHNGKSTVLQKQQQTFLGITFSNPRITVGLNEQPEQICYIFVVFVVKHTICNILYVDSRSCKIFCCEPKAFCEVNGSVKLLAEYMPILGKLFNGMNVSKIITD